MRILSCFVPFLGAVNAVKERKNIRLSLWYWVSFFINVLFLFCIYLGLKKGLPWDSFKYLGKIPFCNKIPERALQIDGIVFPLCFRCMSFVLGLYLVIITLLVFTPKPRIILLGIAVLCILPCLADGLLQTFTGYESQNIRRIVFGFLCGLGAGYTGYSGIMFLFGYKRKTGISR